MTISTKYSLDQFCGYFASHFTKMETFRFIVDYFANDLQDEFVISTSAYTLAFCKSVKGLDPNSNVSQPKNEIVAVSTACQVVSTVVAQDIPKNNRKKNRYAKKIFAEGAVYTPEDIQPIREQVPRCAPPSHKPFHCDLSDVKSKPRKGKKVIPLPTLESDGFFQQDDFDWAAETPEAKKALERVPMMRVVREFKQKLESETLMLTNGSDDNCASSVEQSSDVIGNNGNNDNNGNLENVQQLNINESSKMCASNGVAIISSKSSLFGSKLNEFKWLLSRLQMNLNFQLESCLFCLTADHNMVTCGELPSFKLNRIVEYKLCSKCLYPEHLEDACEIRDQIYCLKCGDNHLSYVYH